MGVYRAFCAPGEQCVQCPRYLPAYLSYPQIGGIARNDGQGSDGQVVSSRQPGFRQLVTVATAAAPDG
ncbi:unnamed protein product [Boreogadus saida]